MDEDHEKLDNRITRLEERVSEMDKATGIMQALFERTMTVQEKLACTMEGISDTMVQIKISMSAMQTEMVELHKEMTVEKETRKEEDARLKSKIEGVEGSVRVIDDNSKINWMAVVKNGFITVLAGSGIFAIVDYLVDAISKIPPK